MEVGVSIAQDLQLSRKLTLETYGLERRRRRRAVESVESAKCRGRKRLGAN